MSDTACPTLHFRQEDGLRCPQCREPVLVARGRLSQMSEPVDLAPGVYLQDSPAVTGWELEPCGHFVPGSKYEIVLYPSKEPRAWFGVPGSDPELGCPDQGENA